MTLPMSLMLVAPVALMTSRNGRLRLRFRHLLGKIGRDDLDLAALPIGKLRAAGLVVELDRFLALLDHLLQQAEKFLVGERLLALAPAPRCRRS